MSSNTLNDYKIVKSKKLLIAMLSMTTFLSFANANNYHINKPSEAEAMQIVENPDNQNKDVPLGGWCVPVPNHEC